MVERPDFVVRHKRRVWAWLLLVLAVLYAAWFSYVIYGEQQAFGDDPARWAGGVTTFSWAILGLFIYALTAVYFIALLIRREVPAQTYQIGHTSHEHQGGSPETVTADTHA